MVDREALARGRPLRWRRRICGWDSKRWSAVYGGMVAFAGFGDCLAMPAEVESDVNQETADMKAMVTLLAKPLIGGEEKRLEFRPQEIANAAHDGGFFDWLLDGKEVESDERVGVKDYMLKPDSASRFFKLFKRYAPEKGARIFRVTPDKSVRLSCTGKNRQRRYILELPV
jgi:hypothetical protein